MKRLVNRLCGMRLWALILKELRHIKRDRHLVATLVIPPTIQLVIFGLALNPEVSDLRLGVVDECRTYASRDLVSAFTESRSFQIAGHYGSPEEMGRDLSAGNLDAGLIIPADFARERARETQHARLGRNIVQEKRRAALRGTRRDIDNFSFALLFHRRINRLHAQKQPFHIDRHHAIPLIGVDFHEGFFL